jgi:hypothetical protein
MLMHAPFSPRQVAAAVGQVDTRLCAGLDSLVTKVPALQEATPALYDSTKEAAVSYAALTTTYLATRFMAFLGFQAAGTTAEVEEENKGEVEEENEK